MEADNLYVVDYGNRAIRKITPAGVVTTLAGSAFNPQGKYQDGTGFVALLGGPGQLAADANGNVYFCDGAALRKITPTGVVSTFAGSTSSVGFQN